ncbi:MAG: ChbG/HpnK family deacetylase [Spirochaetota bacterium]
MSRSTGRNRTHAAVAALALVFALIAGGCMTGSGTGGARIIVNADDVGAHPAFTDASLEALETGRISSASVIVPGPDAERAFGLFEQHPDYALGVHLALNGDWAPLTPSSQAPSLVNDRGTMWDTPQEVAANVRPEEARMEFHAQVRAALEHNVDITHIDGHMGCYFHSPELFMAALDVANEHGIPLVAPFLPQHMRRRDRHLYTVETYTGIYEIPGKAETYENRRRAYRELLTSLAPGLHYVYSHHGRPGVPATELPDIELRINDFDFWTSESARSMLEEIGVEVVEIGELAHEAK